MKEKTKKFSGEGKGLRVPTASYPPNNSLTSLMLHVGQSGKENYQILRVIERLEESKV